MLSSKIQPNDVSTPLPAQEVISSSPHRFSDSHASLNDILLKVHLFMHSFVLAIYLGGGLHAPSGNKASVFRVLQFKSIGPDWSRFHFILIT